MKRIILSVVFLFVLFWLGGLFLGTIFNVPNEPSRKFDYRVESNKPETGQFSIKKEEPGPERAKQNARVALVIDDLGWVRSTVPLFEQLNIPITMGVLPGRPRSRQLYERWAESYEFILHMPMEPLGYPEDDPGKFALMTSMPSGRIKKILRHFLNKYPRIVGLNNHMGSAFTSERTGMNAVMEVLADRDLFYLDSLTSSNSVARKVAREHGVPVISNQVFLDRQINRSAIRQQFKRLIRMARSNGAAVGIGHIQNAEMARVLLHWVPYYKKRGIKFVYLSKLINLSQLHPRATDVRQEIFESEK